MKELLTVWASEINRKKAFRYILKELRLSFCLFIENEQILVKIENDTLQLIEHGAQATMKRLSGKREAFLSIFKGERKLTKAVYTKEVETTLSFREQLLLESLFYLARPRAFF